VTGSTRLKIFKGFFIHKRRLLPASDLFAYHFQLFTANSRLIITLAATLKTAFVEYVGQAGKKEKKDAALNTSH
jgi:hypothetical protein